MDGAERVRFQSRTPATFRALFQNLERLESDSVDAHLFMPENRVGPLPVVVISVGSLGLGSGRESLYAGALVAADIAVLVVDSFGSRGFNETVSDQGRISFAASCADSFYALLRLASDPRFDRRRIGLLGYSRGGRSVLLANDERLHRAMLGQAAPFAAYVALYPSVWLRWENPRPSTAPMLIALGGVLILRTPATVRA